MRREAEGMGGEPLRLTSEDAAVLGYVSDLYALLRAIDETMPTDATLYVEGTSIARAVEEFLTARQAAAWREVEPNTISPKPRTFHLPLQGTNLAELRAIADRHAEPEVCSHLVVYRGDDVLLWAHDPGSGYVELARSLPEDRTSRFRAALGAALRSRE